MSGQSHNASGPASPPLDIAIVGLATLLPGANDPQVYWQRLLANACALRQVPEDRWLARTTFGRDPSVAEFPKGRVGGFIDDVLFDPLEFGIVPSAIPHVEPAQLLALHLVRAALDDALQGATEDPDLERTSALFGFSGGMGELGTRYVARSALPGLMGVPPQEVLDNLPEWSQDSFAGILPNVISGRIANRLNLGGTNITIDAENASSLAALSLGVMELQSGRVDRVIAGGVDVTQTAFGYLGQASAGGLSGSDQPTVLDQGADGSIPSEGMAAVVLRRVADAERDGDRIYAVIRGVGAATGAEDDRLDRPSAAVQAQALNLACAQAGINAAQIGLFELDSSGDAGRQAAELEVVQDAVAQAQGAPGATTVGSVKALIGHTKAASGIAGLIKTALAVYHRTLPPHPRVETVPPALSHPSSPLALSHTPRPWAATLPQMATVGATGTGGIAYQVVLQAHSDPDAVPAAQDAGVAARPLALAAANRDELLAALAEAEAAPVADVHALSLHLLRKSPPSGPRLAFMARDVPEARARLAELRRALSTPDTPLPAYARYCDAVDSDTPTAVAVLLPGEEAAHPGMAQKAAVALPEFARHAPAPLATDIWPAEAKDIAARRAAAEALAQPEPARQAVTGVQTGMLALLSALGLSPMAWAARGCGRDVARAHAAPEHPLFDIGTGAPLSDMPPVEDDDAPADPSAVLQALDRAGARTFLDIGPGSAVADRLRRIAPDRAEAILSLDQDGGDLAALLDGAAAIWVRGGAVDLRALLLRLGAPRPVPRAPSRTAWRINGAYARPADAPPRQIVTPDAPLLPVLAPKPPEAVVPAPEPSAPHTALPRFVQVPFAEDAAHAVRPLPRKFPVVVTETEDGRHITVLAELKARRTRSIVLPLKTRRDAEALDKWCQKSLPKDAPVGLIHLDGCAAMPDLSTLSFADWRALHETGCKETFGLLQRLAPWLETGGRLVIASETGGLFGRTAETSGTGLSAAPGSLGLVRALTLEWLDCAVKAVDLDPADPQSARALVDELSFVQGRREVGYPGGVRTIFRTEPATLCPPETPTMSPDKDWVVLATGGARGITAECLRTLAPSGARLVLIGRSPAPDPEPGETQALDVAGLRKHYFAQAKASGAKPRPAEIEAQVNRHLAARDMRQNLADLTALGATVDYRAADAADPDALRAVIDALYAEFGRIDCVVHGAGLIDDGLLTGKTRDSFDRVFDTKVDSAFVLARALRPESLRALVFFTSVAGRYGNRGQTDYAAANETLNRLAWSLKRQWPEVAVRAINWGPWGQTTTGAGMVTDAVRAQFLSRGIGMVEAGPGRDYFHQELIWAPMDAVESVAWVADGEAMEEAACALPPGPDAELVAADAGLILQGALRRADGLGLDWRLDLVSAPFMDHHRFDGQPVLPMAAFLQAASEVPAILGVPGDVVSLENIHVLGGIALKQPTQALQISFERQDAGLYHMILSEAEPPGRRCYRCDLRIGTLEPAAAPPVPPAVTTPWSTKTVPELYRDWLSHGPLFQTVTDLQQLTPELVISTVRSTRPSDYVAAPESARWTFDVGMLDGVLQSLWFRAVTTVGNAALPVSIRALRRYPGAVEGPVTAAVHVTSAKDSLSVDCDISVWDAAGTLIYQIDGFHGQSAPQLNRLAGGWHGGRRGRLGK